MAGFEGWTAAVARQAFTFLRAGAEALEGRGGTLVQVTGGPARRASPLRGLVAAAMTAGMAPGALVREQDVVEAVRHLAGQSPRGMTHELVVTQVGDRWLP